MESWRKVFRDGLVPLMPTEELEALRDALKTDSPFLIQGATTQPPPISCVSDWPIEAGCLIAYPFAATHGGFHKNLDGSNNLDACTVAEAESGFAAYCFEIDQRLGEPAATKWLLDDFDGWPRAEMIANLLPEVERALAARKQPTSNIG